MSIFRDGYFRTWVATEATRIQQRFIQDPIQPRVMIYPGGVGISTMVPGVFRFTLNVFPGNNRIIVSNDTWVDPDFRGRGLARDLADLKEKMAHIVGATRMMATVRSDNPIQLHLMKVTGWRSMGVMYHQPQLAIEDTPECTEEAAREHDVILWVKDVA